MNESDNVYKYNREIETTIQRLGLDKSLVDKIGQNDEGWMKDFMLGISCGIAAQKMLR